MNSLRIGEVEGRHNAYEVGFAGLHAESWVVGLLLLDRADAVPVIVMPGVDQRVLREAKNLLMNRAIESRGVSVLKVRTPTAT